MKMITNIIPKGSLKDKQLTISCCLYYTNVTGIVRNITS